MNEFTDLAPLDGPEDDRDTRHPDGGEDRGSGEHGYDDHCDAIRRPADIERHDGVHEHDNRLKESSELTQTEVRDDHLEQRVARPDEHEVEVPVANQLRQQVEVANGQLGDRERDTGDAVEERDFLHAPAAELRHVVEDDEDCDEVEERDEEHAEHVEGERGPVLPLGTYASRDESDVEGDRLSHPAPPASAYPARTPQDKWPGARAASRPASRAWRRALDPVVTPTKTSTGSWSMLGKGVAAATV